MVVKAMGNKYKTLSLPMKATIWFVICQILQKGINILTMPIMTRLLPAIEYGRASIFMSWENIFLIFITVSSNHSMFLLCSKTDNKEKVLSKILGLNLVLALLWAILCLIFMKQICMVTGMSCFLIINLYFLCLAQCNIFCWSDMMKYTYSYKSVVAQSLVYSAVSCCGALFAIVFIARTAEAKIVPQVVAAIAISTFIIIRSAIKGREFYDPDIWKFSIGFCVPQIPHYLSEIILMNSDRIMIDHMCGASDVAVYSVAYSAGSLITMVTSAINAAFAPYQYQKILGKEYKILAKNTNYIIMFVAFCLCGVMMFGREVILILGGKKYIESISLIIPISLGVFFNYVFQLFARVQECFEQKHTIVIASVSCALLNIVLNLVFIHIFGYQAAAYTTFICYLVFCFLHYYFYRKVCRKFVGQEIFDIKGLCIISAVLIVLSLIINIINKVYILKYVIIFIAFAFMVWQRRKIIKFIKSIWIK